MSDGVIVRVPTQIPLSRIHPNEWNPNVQADAIFNRLVDEIKEDGFDHPLQVVPWPDYPEMSVGEESIEFDGGSSCHFKIIGGEHRWKAASVLGMESVPCTVYLNWDEQAQKLKTVRRNLLSGELDDKKFTSLVESMRDSFALSDQELSMMMGFKDDDEYVKHLITTESTGEDKSWLHDAMKESSVEIDAVNSMSDVLNHIFSQHGDTVPQGFLFFAHKGRTHLMCLMNNDLQAEVEKMVTVLKETKQNINDYMLVQLRKQ